MIFVKYSLETKAKYEHREIWQHFHVSLAELNENSIKIV